MSGGDGIRKRSYDGPEDGSLDGSQKLHASSSGSIRQWRIYIYTSLAYKIYNVAVIWYYDIKMTSCEFHGVSNLVKPY